LFLDMVSGILGTKILLRVQQHKNPAAEKTTASRITSTLPMNLTLLAGSVLRCTAAAK